MGTKLLSNGNLKIGNDTLIFNMCSATDCPSRRLGLCKIPDRCYAMKAERCYPQVLPYRRRQEELWLHSSSDELFKYIEPMLSKRIKYFRFSEAGDFRTQDDINKMSALADKLAEKGVISYGYTARNDLDFSVVGSNLCINGSSFRVHNSFTATDNPNGLVCRGNCRECVWCKTKKGLDIKVRIH